MNADREPNETPESLETDREGSGDQPSDARPSESTPSESPPSESTPSARLVGHRLGDYQVLRKLGRGGMADVYAARHLTLGRDVAIKVLRSDFARDTDYVERFRREARAAANLNDPSIVQVYDVGSVDHLHFIAQELIDGENLREYIGRVGSISPDEAVDVLLAVGTALETACERGITHRDIKPENLMRSSKGVIKVADFGLARLGPESGQGGSELTKVGLTLGTPRYMSPEQVQGRPVDVRSDLYSLGVSLYHLLAGRPPFEADDPIALAVMHLHETPPPIDRVRGADDLPEWLIAVVSKLMQKSPDDRFRSPAELLEAVRAEAALTAGPGLGPIGSAAATVRLQRVSDHLRATRRRRWVRRSALLLAVAGWAAIATAAAMRLPAPSVDEQLVSNRVPQAETVEEQYLIALTRNDPSAWNAVSKYFPPDDNATNTDYHHKAMLQLARWYLHEEQWRQARDHLRSLLAEPKLSKLHRAIALIRLCEAADAAGDTRLEKDARDRLTQAFNALKTENPAALELFRFVVPEQERVRWGLVDVNTTG